jgi:signal peptidase I
MFNWKRYRALKQARETLHGGRKWLRLNRDLLTPPQIAEVNSLLEKLADAMKRKNDGAAGRMADELHRKIQTAMPGRRHSAWRENVEVFLVAAIVAMGIRTFFIQPFKIPTGSMQPTLFGMVVDENYDRDAALPRRVFDVLIRGKWPVNPHANFIQSIGGVVQWMVFGAWPRGGVCIDRGDHIFVDRFSYHFRPPRRGEIIVFDTINIPAIPEGSRGKFYIKRLVGLGDDIVQIREPHVLINGRVLDSRPAFERIYSLRDGYNGYVLPDLRNNPQYFRRAEDTYRVPPGHLFVLGDNSRHSLDGRYWGAVPIRDLVGRAFMVYWPFTKRTGWIE